MSDQDPYEPTTRQGGGQAPPPADRTQRLPQGGAAVPPRPAEPVSYTEEYSAAGERTLYDDGDRGVGAVPGPPTLEGEEEQGRTWPTLTLVLVSIAAVMVGAVLTLLLLPEEQPVLADPMAQQALLDAQQSSADQAIRITELEAMVAERDAQIAQLQAQQAGDQAAADQAQAERQAALDQREAALAEREAQVAQREDTVAARESVADQQEAEVAAGEPAADGGSEGFDLPEVTVPADLPQIDEEVARGVVERFIDRLQSLFGS